MKRSTRRELLERVRAQLPVHGGESSEQAVRAERDAVALTALADLDVASYPHEPLLPAMWQLRENLTA